MFIDGRSIGGFDDMQVARESGALFGLLSAAGVESTGDEMTEEQLLAARRAMVPAPQLEPSLLARGVLIAHEGGILPDCLENMCVRCTRAPPSLLGGGGWDRISRIRARERRRITTKPSRRDESQQGT